MSSLKKIRYLGIVALVAFAGLILFHLYTFQIFEENTQAYRQALYRLIAYQKMVATLRETENLFNQTPLVSLPENFPYYLDRLQRKMNESESVLRTIINGGVLRVVFPLNLTSSDRISETVRITKDFLSESDLHNIVAGLKLLRQMYAKEKELLQQKFSGLDRPENSVALANEGWEFVVFAKKIDSIFRRMIENANAIYHYNRRMLVKIATAQEQWMRFSRSIEFLLFVLILGLMLTIAYYYTRDLREKNRRLKEKIYTDELTGLKTRYYLQDHFTSTERSCLALLDLQGFARIVSLYGTAFADRILQQVAQRLRKALSERECALIRYAEDIFGIYEEGSASQNRNLVERIEHIREVVEAPEYLVGGITIKLHCVVGVAEGINCKEEAFVSLVNAKHKLKPFYIYQNENYQKFLAETLEWEQRVDRALASDNIHPFAQPIVDRSGRLVGYEILMRLREEREGAPAVDHPPTFLSIARDTGRYLALSRQMLHKAFAACESMKYFSVNLGKEEIESPEMWRVLEMLIERYNARDRVVFEILEQDYFDESEEISRFVDHFRRLGVKIAVDDFGSGYSSFRRVVALRPQILKIDGSMIQDLPHDPDLKKVIELIVAFARSMGITTVAEFVENEAIFREARSLGIDYFQGYYFGPPCPCDQLS